MDMSMYAVHRGQALSRRHMRARTRTGGKKGGPRGRFTG
jgi:hypothetical protein